MGLAGTGGFLSMPLSGLSASRAVVRPWITAALSRSSTRADTRLRCLSDGTARAPHGTAALLKPLPAQRIRATLAVLPTGTPRTVRPVPPGVLRHPLLVRRYTRWHTSPRVGDTTLRASMSALRNARSLWSRARWSLALMSLTQALPRRCACPWHTNNRAARRRAHTSRRSRWLGWLIRSREGAARPATRTRSRTRR